MFDLYLIESLLFVEYLLLYALVFIGLEFKS
jgi:hypothetical protein